MLLKVADEYNESGHLIYSMDHIGAYVRGKTREEALKKFPDEILRYRRWSGERPAGPHFEIMIAQEKASQLQVCDADSDIILETESAPLTRGEYERLKSLALKSAQDFLRLYGSVPEKDKSVLAPRTTFYGAVPITAREMYEHTKNVNSYYFSEINVEAGNEPDIFTCRLHGFHELEQQADFLRNVVFDGSYGEQWSLRKVCRRFIWHDRIHAKAMYKMAVRLCGADRIENPFHFAQLPLAL